MNPAFGDCRLACDKRFLVEVDRVGDHSVGQIFSGRARQRSLCLLAPVGKSLRGRCVNVGCGLPDDGVHGPNEKLSLPTFYRFIDSMIYFFDELRRSE